MSQKNYLKTIYGYDQKPFTDYPKKLINYLIKRLNLKKKQKILEIGCGRGEFLNEFCLRGLKEYGTDISNYSKQFFPNLNFKQADLTKESLPYNDNFFDIVFSKSFVEHFYYPEKIFQEAYRVLKPGGIIITLTPEWKYVYKSFYDDYTHRVPFTKASLNDIHKINNFKEIYVESFIQLPALFEKNIFYPFNKFLAVVTRIFLPDFLKMKNKWIRFSKEVMLLSIAKK
jgi:ubiquinone/menaquinone biosynthesis C-methylase UbiE